MTRGQDVDKMPIPPDLWRRLCEFVTPGRHGRVELDVKDGRVVGMRLLESVRAGKDDEPMAA